MINPMFQDVNLNIHESWKLGLVGRNGRGKTTFLKILMDQLDYEGSIHSNLEFEYFPIYPEKDLTTLDVLLERNPLVEIWEIERELNYMELSHDILYRNFNQLSGGEQTKILLIELFLDDQAFPLIDEPTNNLDLHGRQMVGQYLNNKTGYIVVSHDEYFLNQFVDHILAINKESIDLIAGDVDTWKTEKERADRLTKEKNEKLKGEIKRLDQVSRQVNNWGLQRENSTKDSSERRLAAKQMKRAKAIRKRTEEKVIEKEELIDNIEEVSKLKFNVVRPQKQILSFREFSILRGGVPLFSPINVDLYPSERLFIEGHNGVGKSTLLNFIIGEEKLETIGEYDIKLPEQQSVLHQKNQGRVDLHSYLQSMTSKEEKEEYLYLLHQLGMSRKLFSSPQGKQWSSGEKKKMLLAKALLNHHQLFIWDEVTNSLDLFVIYQLIDAINDYQPTMISVDHNEHYVDAVATKKVLLDPYNK
ncbi:ATP-binding cassette domain-containing protein [Aquisalibacillus elongatus]|nr:ATP-binding cassette domain-containing protein [Aquisalibacillus elongatus]